MFERFTDRARQATIFAEEEAKSLGHGHIGTEHLLFGLARDSDGISAKVLLSFNITSIDVREQIQEIIGKGGFTGNGHHPYTPRAMKVLELSLKEALSLGHNYIGTEHLLLGLIREGEGVGPQILTKRGASFEAIRNRTIQEMVASLQ